MIKCGRPRKGEELLSRDRLLDTALKLFLEYGYGDLRLETIARDAHVSMRTIYNQFENSLKNESKLFTRMLVVAFGASSRINGCQTSI